MTQGLSSKALRQENLAYIGTGARSQENRSLGFVPAFHDCISHKTAIARFSNGKPAPLHILDGLPKDWIVRQDRSGKVTAIKSSIVSGFARAGVFYTREQAAGLASTGTAAANAEC